MPVPPGLKLAATHSAARAEPVENTIDDGDAKAECGGHVGGCKGAVRPRESRYQITEWIGHRFGEGVRNAWWQRDSERITQPPGVFDRGPSLFAGDSHTNGASMFFELGQPARRRATRSRLRCR